jgi:hypothetical protein
LFEYYISLAAWNCYNIAVFPQSETGDIFKFTDKNTQKQGLINTDGDIIIDAKYDLIYPLTDGYYYAEKPIEDDDSTSDDFTFVIFRISDGKEIINSGNFGYKFENKNSSLSDYPICISEDKTKFFLYLWNKSGFYDCFFYDNEGNLLKKDTLSREDLNDKYLQFLRTEEDDGIKKDYYCHVDEDGNKYIDLNFYTTYLKDGQAPEYTRTLCDYLNLELDTAYGVITSDKRDDSYHFKCKEIGDKLYFALFKTLGDDETAEDYIPKEQPADWAAENIRKATEEGLLYNNSNCLYKEPITRYDFCVLAMEAFCKAQGMDIEEYLEKNNIDFGLKNKYDDCDNVFEDTDNVYILLANYLGIVSGTSENKFEPFEYITRQQAAVILSNMAKVCGLKSNSEKVNFIDKQYFAKWAAEGIYNVSSIKNVKGVAIMSGTEENKFSPWMYYTREQAYTTIYRLYEMCK